MHILKDKNTTTEILQDTNKRINRELWKFFHVFEKSLAIAEYTSAEVYTFNNDCKICGHLYPNTSKTVKTHTQVVLDMKLLFHVSLQFPLNNLMLK